MGRDVNKNSLISSATFTDLAGNTGMTYPNAGEYELGTSGSFLGKQAYNADGTLTAAPAVDEIFSSILVCDVCGHAVKDKKELVKQKTIRGTFLHCRLCIDEVHPRRGK